MTTSRMEGHTDMCESVRAFLETGKGILGMELGSTRVKTVIIGEEHMPLAEGTCSWESKLLDGYWTYSLDEVWNCIRVSFAACMKQAEAKYGIWPHRFAAMGISAMMHGYLAFDAAGELLVPFRTWRNMKTERAATALTELFQFNIPHRYSIAHLYQAVINEEPHINRISKVQTLAAYVHDKLTGFNVLGVGDASGMFPINPATGKYDQQMISRFNELEAIQKMPWNLEEVLPSPLMAGEYAGLLTKEGAGLLDPTGKLAEGIPMCPPEGDAQTGMIATNSVGVRTGNVSAGTSAFAILVLERELSRVYPEIDIIVSPSGHTAANVHCNNCTSDINAWVNLFAEFASELGNPVPMDELFTTLFQKALKGDKDCGGLLAYNYYSGESITDTADGRPLFVRTPNARFTLSNMMRTQIYTAIATLVLGMKIVTEKEEMTFDTILAHGGLFKTQGVAQNILASALNTPVTLMETAELGGPWGIALLAEYMVHGDGATLEEWLDQRVFKDLKGETVSPDPQVAESFQEYLEQFQSGLVIEKTAIQTL